MFAIAVAIARRGPKFKISPPRRTEFEENAASNCTRNARHSDHSGAVSRSSRQVHSLHLLSSLRRCLTLSTRLEKWRKGRQNGGLPPFSYLGDTWSARTSYLLGNALGEWPIECLVLSVTVHHRVATNSSSDPSRGVCHGAGTRNSLRDARAGIRSAKFILLQAMPPPTVTGSYEWSTKSSQTNCESNNNLLIRRHDVK